MEERPSSSNENYTNLSDAELVRAIAEKDETALASLIERYAAKMYTFASRSAGTVVPPEDIEEVVSDSFFKVWKTASEYDEDTASVSTWLGWIVFYQSLTAKRKALRNQLRITTISQELSEKIRSESKIDEEVEDRNETERLIKLVNRHLRELEPKEADIVIRRYLLGENTADIARKMQISPGNVRMRVHRSMQRLRQMLAAEMNESE